MSKKTEQPTDRSLMLLYTHVQKGRDGVAVNVDHLQVGETVDAAHAQPHDAEYEGESRQSAA